MSNDWEKLDPHKENNSLSFEEIEELVRRFREGDSSAAERLIAMFQPILQRGFRFMRQGYVGHDEIFAGLCKIFGNGSVAEGSRAIAERLRYLEDDEIWAEIHYCFLLAAHTSSNLQYGFRRNVARRIGHLLARKRRDIVYLEDLEGERPGADNSWQMTEWILGITASDLFADLTQRDRELLYRRIVLEEPFCSIAEALQTTEREVLSWFRRLIKQLRARWKEHSDPSE